MTPDQRFKGGIFSANQKGFEQLCVCQPIRFLQEGHSAKMADDSAHGRSCHTEHLDAWLSVASNIVAQKWHFDAFIFRRLWR